MKVCVKCNYEVRSVRGAEEFRFCPKCGANYEDIAKAYISYSKAGRAAVMYARFNMPSSVTKQLIERHHVNSFTVKISSEGKSSVLILTPDKPDSVTLPPTQNPVAVATNTVISEQMSKDRKEQIITSRDK